MAKQKHSIQEKILKRINVTFVFWALSAERTCGGWNCVHIVNQVTKSGAWPTVTYATPSGNISDLGEAPSVALIRPTSAQSKKNPDISVSVLGGFSPPENKIKYEDKTNLQTPSRWASHFGEF